MTDFESFAGYPFTSAELGAVCEKYASDLVSSAEGVSLDFSVAAGYGKKMLLLAQRAGRRGKRRVLYRRAAVAAVVFALFFSTVMFTNVHAREGIVRWMRHILPDRIVYMLFGESSDEPRGYTVGWVPEGFVLAESGGEDDPYSIYRKEDSSIIIDYFEMGEYDVLEFCGYASYTFTETSVNGMDAAIYQDDNSSNLDMVIFDEENNSIICISSDAELSDVIKVAESIK